MAKAQNISDELIVGFSNALVGHVQEVMKPSYRVRVVKTKKGVLAFDVRQWVQLVSGKETFTRKGIRLYFRDDLIELRSMIDLVLERDLLPVDGRRNPITDDLGPDDPRLEPMRVDIFEGYCDHMEASNGMEARRQPKEEPEKRQDPEAEGEATPGGKAVDGGADAEGGVR